jgi:hypothetical protein
MKAINVFVNHPIINGNQSKAARVLGTKQANVHFWLNHKKGTDMPLSLLPKAAEALGMKPSEFIAQVFE